MWRAAPAMLGVALAAAIAADAAAAGVAVEVQNASQPVSCAEEDNVTITFTSSRVRQFRIEARHPAYLDLLRHDRFDADYTGCAPETRGAAGASAPPRRTTLYETVDTWLVGLTFASFWRPARAVVRVGDRAVGGLHLLQLWRIRPMGGEEVLVLYPQDGYWRMRPLAPAGMAPTAFGSSFLIGPIEPAARPYVDLTEVAFDPQALSFTLKFARGGSAAVRAGGAEQNRQVLDVALDRPIEKGPFAALRSMYVSETNNDVARIAVRAADAPGWRESAVMAFERASASEVWAGRTTPSRHNSSAPDMAFSAFSDTVLPARGAP
jgi:hypothetical protein